MLPNELMARIRGGEDSRTEFKSVASAPNRLPDRDDLAKEICAFANSGGGAIVLGVEDDGTITGLTNRIEADFLDRHVAQVASDGVHPPIACARVRVDLGGLLVMIVEVPGFRPERPFRGKQHYFVRDGPIARPARRDELVRLLQSSAHEHFDEAPVDAATPDDLDPLAIQEFLRKAYPELPGGFGDRYLRALHALDERGVPTTTGVLLFGRDPQRFFLDAYVTGVRFPGVEIGGKFLDRREIRGTIEHQLESGFAFLREHTHLPSHVAGLTRQDEGIPDEVLREAMQNALVHRDYQVASQVRLFVFDDRIEIANPGQLLNRLTPDGIRLGVSQRRNPHLAAALARLGHRENVGLGVPEMFRRMRERGLPEPELVTRDAQFRLVLRTVGAPP